MNPIATLMHPNNRQCARFANPWRRWPFSLASKTAATVAALLLASGLKTAFADDPNILFQITGDAFSALADGAPTGNWPTVDPTGGVLTSNPNGTVMTINGQKWEWNQQDSANCYKLGRYDTAIPVNGVTIVTACRPVRASFGNWKSIVDCFYSDLTLGVENSSGNVVMWRKNNLYWTGVIIPNGEITILSMVVQPTGQIELFVNGVSKWTTADTAAMTTLDPNCRPEWGNPDFTHYITLGRNAPDGWTTFNGNIGDTYFYKIALDSTTRGDLETALIAKYGSAAMYTINATAGTGGTVSPAGAVSVPQNASQAIAITPNMYFDVTSVIVDAATSNTEVVSGTDAQTYTFSNVTESHTIDASFTEWVDTRVTGTVTADGSPLGNVLITATGHRGPFTTTTSNVDGTYSLRVRPGDIYTVAATLRGYSVSGSLTAGPGNLTGKDFTATYVGNEKLIDLKVDPAFVDDVTLTSWPNTGTLGGYFVADGNWDTSAPTTKANIGGLKAVKFLDNKMILSSSPTSTSSRIMAPASITGPGSNFTVFAKIYSDGAGQYDPWEQMFLAWSRRDGPEGSCASFGYGKGWWGAIGGWGWGDTNYGALYPGTDRTVAPAWGQWNTVAMTSDGTTVKIYYNGAVVNTVTKSFVFHNNMEFSLGSQYWNVGEGRALTLNGALAALQVWSLPMSDAEIAALSGVLTRTVSGTITDAGGPVSGASVSLKNGTTVVAGPYTTGGDGAYTLTANFADGDTCTVSAQKTGDLPGTLPVSILAGVNDYPNSNITLATDTSYDPTLIFSMTVDSLTGLTPGSATGNRSTVYPVGGTMVALGSPKVIDVDGLNWEKNTYSAADGYRFVAPDVPGGSYTAPIAASGVSVVAVVQPNYIGVGGEPRGEIVDLFYNELFLAVSHNPGNEGNVIVDWRGYSQHDTGYKIPNGQKTILCLVVQQNGNMNLFANGALVWNAASGVDYSTLQPLSWAKTITVGRNDFDGWSTFSGNIGDVYLYKTAISDSARNSLQSSLATKFGITLPVFHTIAASADANGTISPSGNVDVVEGADKTFSFIPNDGFVDVVTVDGIPQPGHPTSYTFTNVTAPHTISVTFTVVTTPPPNDNFADAIVLSGASGTQTGTRTNHATFEANEPVCAYGTTTNTVWFKWTAPSNGTFHISTLGSRNSTNAEWDAVVGAYTGTMLTDLVTVPGLPSGNPQDTGLEETMQFAVTAGTTYYFQMGGYGAPPDNAINVLLTWSFVGSGTTYSDWALSYAGGQAANLDYNNDGVPNGIAYFMGVTGAATNPAPDASNMVTWPMSATFSGTFSVETSSNLETWTPVDPQPVRDGFGNVSYTLPPGAGKVFVRLTVTPN